MKTSLAENKIVVLCPYFGKFLNYSQFTFESMERNSHVDWVIITDNIIGDVSYKNISFVKFSFADIQQKIKEKIGTEIKSVYKLCDYKPTYAYIFDDIVEGYDFWGYCDLDIVFGDLSPVTSLEMLSKYDKILDLGHLSLYRNTVEIDGIFKKIDKYGLSYLEILNSESIYVFDESYGTSHISINEILTNEGYKVFCNRDLCFDSFFTYKNIYPFNSKKKKYTYLEYVNGKLILKNINSTDKKEYIYAHFQKRKFENIAVTNFNNYIIAPRGFFDKNKISKKMFYRFFDFKLFWYLKFKIKRKIKNIKNVLKKRNEKGI